MISKRAPEASHQYALGALADPHSSVEDVSLTAVSQSDAIRWYRDMLLVRRAEETIANMVIAGEVHCPCHLAIGQEACAVGVAAALEHRDKSFGAHRSHGHYLALGGSVDALFAEVMGKASGCSGGMGGSMHLIAPEVGLMGTVPIVGATIPMAVGAGIAATLGQTDSVAVSFFGDGATEEGVFHESMNLAAVMRLPVIFVCEHNLFSSHLHISLRQPADKLARYADAHRVPSNTIDGNDVGAVTRAARQAVARARGGEGPTFLELVTYRWRGHVGPSEDTDVGVARNEQLQFWKIRDPIARLARSIVRAGYATDTELGQIDEQISAGLTSAQASARTAPFPRPQALTGWMWSRGQDPRP